MSAAHWFDAPRFYAECLRVLTSGGCVALGITKAVADFAATSTPIWKPDASGNEDPIGADKIRRLQRVVEEFEGALEWSTRGLWVRQNFPALPMPEEGLFADIRREECKLDVSWNLKQVSFQALVYCQCSVSPPVTMQIFAGNNAKWFRGTFKNC